jgi:hypothetical protein
MSGKENTFSSVLSKPANNIEIIKKLINKKARKIVGDKLPTDLEEAQLQLV